LLLPTKLTFQSPLNSDYNKTKLENNGENSTLQNKQGPAYVLDANTGEFLGNNG